MVACGVAFAVGVACEEPFVHVAGEPESDPTLLQVLAWLPKLSFEHQFRLAVGCVLGAWLGLGREPAE